MNGIIVKRCDIAVITGFTEVIADLKLRPFVRMTHVTTANLAVEQLTADAGLHRAQYQARSAVAAFVSKMAAGADITPDRCRQYLACCS